MASSSSVVLNRMLSKFRVRHLHALLKLTELGNVNRAAQSLGMTQPALTQLLADLERLVEAPLFVRHAKGVTPTPLTVDLLPLVRQMMHRLTEAAELMAAHLSRSEGTVRVASTPAGANGLLAQLLPDFVQEHPQVQVLVTEVDIPAISPSVDTGSADIVICREPPVLPQGWRFESCIDDHFVVVAGLSHPLARHRVLKLADLRGMTWLPNAAGSAALERQEALFGQIDEVPRRVHVITRISPLTWVMLDRQALLTVVPFSVVRPWVDRGQLVVLPLEVRMPFAPLGMLMPQQGLSTASLKLIDFARDRATRWRQSDQTTSRRSDLGLDYTADT